MNDKAFINGKFIDVMDINEYKNKSNLYDNGEAGVNMMGYILPIRNEATIQQNQVGYYTSTTSNNAFDKIILPSSPEESEIYSDSHLASFSQVNNIKDLINEQNKIDSEQVKYLSDVDDNIFRPEIDPIKDTPIAMAMKQAVIDKNIDINKYASRFSKTAFANNKRLFNKNDMSIKKFVELADKLDLSASLVITDRNANVPNPMGHTITINLTDGDSSISISGGKKHE